MAPLGTLERAVNVVAFAAVLNACRALLYAFVPSLSPPNPTLLCLNLLLLLNAAARHAPLAWPAAARLAPPTFHIPPYLPCSPAVRDPSGPSAFIYMLSTLLPHATCAYLAACGCLLQDPNLPFSQLYLWLPALAFPVTSVMHAVVLVQGHGAVSNSEALISAYQPLGLLLPSLAATAGLHPTADPPR